MLRGFVNACRHRGNALCQGGRAGAARFTCPLPPLDLRTRRAAARGRQARSSTARSRIHRTERGLSGCVPVAVECSPASSSSIPDPNAAPLADFLGGMVELLAPYQLEEMVPVDGCPREPRLQLEGGDGCLPEGYHIEGIHPRAAASHRARRSEEPLRLLRRSGVAIAPFEVRQCRRLRPERQIEGIRELPATFPGVAEVLPRIREAGRFLSR